MYIGIWLILVGMYVCMYIYIVKTPINSFKLAGIVDLFVCIAMQLIKYFLSNAISDKGFLRKSNCIIL